MTSPMTFGTDPDDLPRIRAIEHMVTTLWTFYVFNQADVLGMGATEIAEALSKGVQGTVVDAGMPPAFRDAMRGHVKTMMDEVVRNAITHDEIKAR